MTDDELERDALAQTCSLKERAFVTEYVIDQNGTQAVFRAGCFNVTTSESAAVAASRLLKRTNVAALLDVLMAQRATRVNMTADSVLHEMALLSHSDISHYVIDDRGQVQLAAGAPEGAMRAIKSLKRKSIVKLGKGDDAEGSITYEVELTFWDKPAPLKLMGRNVGLFPDKVEVTGKNGAPIEVVTKIERVVVHPEAKAS